MQGGAAPEIRVGLVGAGIQASLSPALHEREAAAQGLACSYRLVDLLAVENAGKPLPELLDWAERAGFRGLNVTHPCKQSVIAHLDRLSPDASQIGAVNTIVFDDRKRVGHNTDWWGFAEAFRRDLADVHKSNVVQLGAGGAGSAVAHALLTLGVESLSIVDTDRARAEQLVEALSRRFPRARVQSIAAPDDIAPAADGLVNTTPVGMEKYPGVPLRLDLLRSAQWVADIIYFPLRTQLLHAAQAIGCRTMNGGGMAVFQAVEAFRLFTGHVADAGRMQRHFAELTGPHARTSELS